MGLSSLALEAFVTDVQLFTPDDVAGWMKAQGREIYLHAAGKPVSP